ncbi:MAG: pseudouridine-5'-phosphate glycosidase [Propionibacteriaceae bacterium]
MRIGVAVQEALDKGMPVLALESTIITHGLPHPRNIDVALESEAQLRAIGVTPATIGVVAGEAVVGLTEDEIRTLADDPNIVKVSTRDLPVAAAKKLNGGTTVAATAFLAHKAGIKVFSTGGLGGVHRGANETFDESADLIALATTPIVVISAGVKSILDIGLTLERLETLGVPVVGYKTRAYPGFFVSESGFEIEYSVDDVTEIAAMVASRDELAMASTILVANPVDPAKQLDPAQHQQILTESLARSEAQGVHGHDVTPFLLEDIRKATGNASLEVNLAVYHGNVALGAEIAKAIAAK